MLAAAITGGSITIENVMTEHIKPISAKLRESGVEISEELGIVHVKSSPNLKAVDIKTHPYPDFLRICRRK